MEYYTYLLINPLTDLPFYVGKGKGNRAWSHLKHYDPHNHHKSGTVRKIQKQGLEPIICIVKNNISNTDAKLFETKLINYYGKYINGGILTNIADGGQGGYTGPVSKATSKKLSKANAGIKNSNAKLSILDVINIYKSKETISDLGRFYNIGPAEIRKIKHKKSWRPVTSKLITEPGYHYKNRLEFLNEGELKQEITDIFLDDRPYTDICLYYEMGREKIKKIKDGKIYKEMTKDLVLPEMIFHGITNSERLHIKQSNLSLKDLSQKYGVHLETIRNIKSLV